MTVLATKLSALKDLAVARAAIRATMLPQPDATRALVTSTAVNRLQSAAHMLSNLDSRRPMGAVIDSARSAASIMDGPVSLLGRHEASLNVRTGQQVLRAEPDVARHIAQRNEAIREGLRNAAW